MKLLTNMYRWLGCALWGHEWSKTHGFKGYPDFGAICSRCVRTAETYEEFIKRTGR